MTPADTTPPRRWPGARGVIATGLVLVLCTWATVLWYVHQDRRAVVEQTRTENAFIASAFEEHARRILRTADTALRFMQRRMQEGGVVTPEMRAFGSLVVEDLQALQIAIADARGDLLYSAIPLQGALNVSDREHFKVHREASPDVGLFVGRPVRSKASGTWTFFLSRRLSRPDGSFGGIVSLGLDPAYFGKVYDNLRVGKDRAGLLVGTDHFVRVRVERDSKEVGDDISGYSPVFREVAAGPVGDYEVDVEHSRTHRLASYRRMPDYPLIVIASAVEEEVLEGWQARRRAYLAAATAVSLIVMGASLLLARARLEARRRGEEALALQAQLSQAQRLEAIGSLAGGVAHDFNNMLGVILGSAELALAEAPPDGMLRECLEEIREAANRSAAVTRQLLTFARKVAVTPRLVDVNAQVGDVLQVLRRLVGAQVDLRWRPGPDLWRVRVDPTQVDQVITNLVANARDAMRDAGTLTIETANVVVDQATCARHQGSTPGEHVAISVTDTGSGIAPEHLATIFEPFFTTKHGGKGTGLGLATVFGIAKQNGGFVSVESQLGKGSTFRFHLPRATGDVAAPAPGAAAGAARRGTERILLVEDERAHLTLVQRMLESAGYQVLAAADPLEALRLTERQGGQIDLLLTDVVMPHMDGRQLHEALQRRRPGLRCLYMSGYPADVLDRGSGLARGQAYLQKPFTLEALLQMVRRSLDG